MKRWNCWTMWRPRVALLCVWTVAQCHAFLALQFGALAPLQQSGFSSRYHSFYRSKASCFDVDLNPRQSSIGKETCSSVSPSDSTESLRSHLGTKTIGVDYGLRRCGVCVSVGYAPRPLPLITHDNDPAKVAAAIAVNVREEGAEQIVVGLPLNTQGGEGEQANCTRVFVREVIKTCSGCRIFVCDERFSSAVAKEKLKEMGYHEKDLKGSGMIDVVAAIGILTDFFDKNGEGAEIVHEAQKVALDAGATAAPQSVPTKSFKEWQKEMMEQAAADENLNRKRKGKKGKRRG